MEVEGARAKEGEELVVAEDWTAAVEIVSSR